MTKSGKATRLFVFILYKSKWQQVVSSEGRKRSPDISIRHQQQRCEDAIGGNLTGGGFVPRELHGTATERARKNKVTGRGTER